MPIRKPAVSGQFYPSDPSELLGTIDSCFTHALGPGKVPPAPEPPGTLYGLICPHAGYVYSGPVAAHSYYLASGVKGVKSVIVLGPNHYGVGSGLSTYMKGWWETPLGRVEIDERLSKEISNASKLVDYDEQAHMYEHSIEVQLPFLQRVLPEGFKLTPICMSMQDMQTALELGETVAKCANDRTILLVGSSDLTHYEPHEEAMRKDLILIGRILELDVEGYYRTLEHENISACGYGPIAVVMGAVKRMGGKRGVLLKYGTSGQTGADYSSVVGYPSVAFF